MQGLLLAVADDAETSIEACARSQAVGLVRRGLLQRALRLVDQTLPAGDRLQKAVLHKLLRANRAKKKHCADGSSASGLDEQNNSAALGELCSTREEAVHGLGEALEEELGQTSGSLVGRDNDLPLPNCISREENAIAATESALALYHSWDVWTVQAALTCCLRRLRAEEAQSGQTLERQIVPVAGGASLETKRGDVASSSSSWSESSSHESDQRSQKDFVDEKTEPTLLSFVEEGANGPKPGHTGGQPAVQEIVGGGEETHGSVEGGEEERSALDSLAAAAGREDYGGQGSFPPLGDACDLDATGVSVVPVGLSQSGRGEPRCSSGSRSRSRQSPSAGEPILSASRRVPVLLGGQSGVSRRGGVGERRRSLIIRVTNVLELMAAYREAMELCGQRWKVWQELEALCQSPEGMAKVVEVLLQHEGHALARTLIKASALSS